MTAPKVDAFTAIRAYLRHDYDGYQAMLDQVDADSFAAALAASFFTVVDRQLGDSHTAHSVIAFVARVRERFDETDDDIDPRAAERLIRAALGDSELAEDLDQRAVAQVESVFLAAMADEASWTDTELDEFLAASRTLADRWTS